MAAQSRQFITLESIINDYLAESEKSIHSYAKLWHLAYRGMEDLGVDFFYAIRSVKLPVLPNKTVQLPLDCLRYTKIGVLNSRGEVVPLIYNSNFTFYADAMPNRQEKTIDNNYLWWWQQNINSGAFYNYWVDGAYTPIYGTPSGAPYQGSYNVDEANGIVLFDEYFQWDYVMIEYVASPQEGNDCNIPMQFREAMIAWLWWKDNKMLTTRKGMIGVQRDLKSTYYNERRLANGRYRPLYLQQAHQLSLETNRMTIKA